MDARCFTKLVSTPLIEFVPFLYWPKAWLNSLRSSLDTRAVNLTAISFFSKMQVLQTISLVVAK